MGVAAFIEGVVAGFQKLHIYPRRTEEAKSNSTHMGEWMPHAYYNSACSGVHKPLQRGRIAMAVACFEIQIHCCALRCVASVTKQLFFD
jgi:hypothetical protein